jgi:hypothetical protein
MQQKRKGYIMQQKDHLMKRPPGHFPHTDGSLRHLLHLHLALLLPLLRLYPPLQREQGAGVFPFALYLPPYREFSIAESGQKSDNSDSSKSRREIFLFLTTL